MVRELNVTFKSSLQSIIAESAYAIGFVGRGVQRKNKESRGKIF